MKACQGSKSLNVRQHYGEDALSRTQAYFWINEVERGRTDLSTVASPGREPDESLAAVIAGKLNTDPHFSARKLAQSLGLHSQRFADT
jgi:hypothetical protein